MQQHRDIAVATLNATAYTHTAPANVAYS